jgi:hypothetical protein
MGNLAAARAHDFNETANDGSISTGRTKGYPHNSTKLTVRIPAAAPGDTTYHFVRPLEIVPLDQ